MTSFHSPGETEVVTDHTPIRRLPASSYLTAQTDSPDLSAFSTLDIGRSDGTARRPPYTTHRQHVRGTSAQPTASATVDNPFAPRDPLGREKAVTWADEPDDRSVDIREALHPDEILERRNPEPTRSSFNLSWAQHRSDGKVRTVDLAFEAPFPASASDIEQSQVAAWAGDLVSRCNEGVLERWDNLQRSAPEYRAKMLQPYPFTHVYNLLDMSKAEVSIKEWHYQSDSKSWTSSSSSSDGCRCNGTDVIVDNADGTHKHYHLSAHQRLAIGREGASKPSVDFGLTKIRSQASPTTLRPSPMATSLGGRRRSRLLTPGTGVSSFPAGDIEDVRRLDDQGTFGASARTDDKTSQLARAIMDLIDNGDLQFPDRPDPGDLAGGSYTSRLTADRHRHSHGTGRYSRPNGGLTSTAHAGLTGDPQGADRFSQYVSSPLLAARPAGETKLDHTGNRSGDRTAF